MRIHAYSNSLFLNSHQGEIALDIYTSKDFETGIWLDEVALEPIGVHLSCQEYFLDCSKPGIYRVVTANQVNVKVEYQLALSLEDSNVRIKSELFDLVVPWIKKEVKAEEPKIVD